MGVLNFEVVIYVRAELEAIADPANIAPMQRYMKTQMPFFGVKSPGVKGVIRTLRQRFKPSCRAEYETWIQALWAEDEREMKYLAMKMTRAWRGYVDVASLPLFEMLIRDGGWWDFVDEVASHLIGTCLRQSPEVMWPLMDRWIDDDNFWIRRTAIICQLRSKEATDSERLFRYCSERAHEKEFFIRKAIGWALRQYSRTDPEAVRAYLAQMGDKLSGLSRREGGRLLPPVEPEELV